VCNMGVSETNTNGAGWGGVGAADKAATSLQNKSAETGLQQFFRASDTAAGTFVPTGDGVSGAAALLKFSGKGGCKGERAATDNNGSKKPNANVKTVQRDPADEKIAAIKEQMADLLDTIEALLPGFAKEVKPRVEANAAAVKPIDTVPDTSEKEAIKAALEELAQMLEEIIALLKGRDDSDKPGDTEATPNNYAVDKDTAQDPKEQTGADAVDAFMSVFNQLSDSAKREVAEILATMASEGGDRPTPSCGCIEGTDSEIYREFNDLVAERSAAEKTPILHLDVVGIEVRVADGEGLALIQEPVLIDGKIVTDGAIIEVGDSVTLTDGRVLTLDGNNSITVENPKTGLGESFTWESTIPDDGEIAGSGSTQQTGDSGTDTAQAGGSDTSQAGGSDTAQAGDSGADTGQAGGHATPSDTTASGTGQSSGSNDSAGAGGASGSDAAAATGDGNDTTGTGNDITGDGTDSQSDTGSAAGSSGGGTDSSGSTGGVDSFSGTDSSSRGTQLDEIGVNGYYRDGVISVEEPVVIRGRMRNGAELRPGDQATLANGNILTFNADGAGCYLQDATAGYARGMQLG
jgi:DNA-directed RNA polymerase subunit L